MPDPMLLPLATHLYGPRIGGRVAEMIGAQSGDRIAVIHRGPLERSPSEVGPEDEAETPQDPLPDVRIADINEFHGSDDPIDVVVGFAPHGHRRERPLAELLERANARSSSKGRAVLLLTAASVAKARDDVRVALASAGQLEVLEFVDQSARARRPGLPTGAALLLVNMRLTGSAHSGRVTVRGHEQDGDPIEFTVNVSANERWSMPSLDPDRSRKLQEWAKQGSARPLGDLVNVIRGGDERQDEHEVLRPAQITSHGLDLTVEVDPSKDERYSVLQEGDIVGRTIGQPRWTLVTAADLAQPLVATHQVLLLRADGVDSRYVLAFLNSSAAERQLATLLAGRTVPRVGTSDIKKLLIPDLDVPDVALEETDPLALFNEAASEVADDIERRYRDAFDKPDPAAVAALLTDATSDAKMAARLVRRVTDPLHRARQFLPHPLARTLRVYQSHRRSGTPRDVYQDLLRFGETAIILLGTVGMAMLEHAERRDLTESWSESIRTSGVSLGTWLAMANAGARGAREAQEPLGGLAAALSTKSPLNEALDEFLRARKANAHGAGPRSDYEYEREVADLEDVLHQGVAELVPLARSTWYIVEGLHWDPDSEVFNIVGRRLDGDHPDFDPWSRARSAPLESGVVHVDLDDLTLPLKPYCVLESCPRCLHEELYYPDRIRSQRVRLRSLDRGHQIELTGQELGLLAAP